MTSWSTEYGEMFISYIDTPNPVRAARDEIRKAAHAGKNAEVYFSPYADQPPRLQRKKLIDSFTRNGKYGPQVTWKSRVIVGRDWLRANLPSAWAAFAAARLTGLYAEFIPHQVQGGAKWQR